MATANSIPPNKRDKYALTYNEFNYIKGFLKYWESKGNGRLVRFDSMEEARTHYTMWTMEFLKKEYPAVKFFPLEYKESVLNVLADKGMEPVVDTVAFKFKPNRPELYLLMHDFPIILDEFQYDAYDKGPFVRPNWDKI